MLKEAIQKVIDLSTSTEGLKALIAGNHDKLKIGFGSKEFMFDPATGGFTHSRSTIPKDKQHKFGTVAALTTYLADLEKAGIANKEKAVVLVSSTGIVAALDEEVVDHSDVLTVPFFATDLPPTGHMNYEQLLTYLDQQSGKIHDEEGLRDSLSVVRVVSNVGAKVIDLGATIRVEATASETVESGATRTSLPKYITIDLRIGTREFEEPHKFRLHITPPSRSGEGLTFRLTKINRDGALESFMEKCIAMIADKLPGWRVYEGPCI